MAKYMKIEVFKGFSSLFNAQNHENSLHFDHENLMNKSAMVLP